MNILMDILTPELAVSAPIVIASIGEILEPVRNFMELLRFLSLILAAITILGGCLMLARGEVQAFLYCLVAGFFMGIVSILAQILMNLGGADMPAIVF